MILGFSQDDQDQLVELIEGAGGRVESVPSRVVPDYAVVPIFGCPVEQTVLEIVTNAWLVREH